MKYVAFLIRYNLSKVKLSFKSFRATRIRVGRPTRSTDFVLWCSPQNPFSAFKVSAVYGGRSTGKLYSTAWHASSTDFGMLRPLTLACFVH